MEQQNSSKHQFKNQLLARRGGKGRGGGEARGWREILKRGKSRCFSRVETMSASHMAGWTNFRSFLDLSCKIHWVKTQRGSVRFVFGRRFMSESVSVDGVQHVGLSVWPYRLIALSASAWICVSGVSNCGGGEPVVVASPPQSPSELGLFKTFKDSSSSGIRVAAHFFAFVH